MTLLVFAGVLVGLLILRLLPGLLLRLLLAIPRHRVVRAMRMIRGRSLSVSFSSLRVPVGSSRLKLVVVSASLLALVVLVTSAVWTWHSTGLMLLLR
jgi:hypothetical protein